MGAVNVVLSIGKGDEEFQDAVSEGGLHVFREPDLELLWAATGDVCDAGDTIIWGVLGRYRSSQVLGSAASK